MTANVLEHRRAKAFAEALEAHQTESRASGVHHSGSTAMAELIGMAEALGALPEPELSMEARTVQRAQLMAAFEQAWQGGPALAVPQQRGHRASRSIGSRSRWGRRLAIGGLVAGVAVGSFAGAAAASSNALPGDALYGMKRGLEGLRLDFAGSDTERGALLLDQASARLDEAQSLLGRAGPASGLSAGTVEQVRQALDDMHAEAIRGRELLRSVYRSNGSLTPMRKLAGFADGQDGRWATMQGQLPPQLTTQASKVDELFSDISEDVAPLHLEQPGKGGATGHGASGGQQAPGGTDGASQGTGSGDASNSQGSGSSSGAGHPGSGSATAPAGVGGLVNGLTNGLTGTAPSGSPAPGQDTKSGGTAAPSSPTGTDPDGQGITIPPLLPGLLPGLTLS